MADIVHASRRELTAEEVLDVVERGGRVVIELSLLGATMRVVIRERDGTYYCDTPMKLLTHETGEALARCLERYRLVSADGVDRTESTEPTTANA